MSSIKVSEDKGRSIPESSITLKEYTPSSATESIATVKVDRERTTATNTTILGKASENISQNGNMNTLQSERCEFGRGGRCGIHGFQGKKGFKVSKKWGLLKCGTYGNVYKRSTIWSSQCQKFSTSARSELILTSDISSSKTERSGGLEGINFEIIECGTETGSTKRTFSEI